MQAPHPFETKPSRGTGGALIKRDTPGSKGNSQKIAQELPRAAAGPFLGFPLHTSKAGFQRTNTTGRHLQNEFPLKTNPTKWVSSNFSTTGPQLPLNTNPENGLPMKNNHTPRDVFLCFPLNTNPHYEFQGKKKQKTPDHPPTLGCFWLLTPPAPSFRVCAPEASHREGCSSSRPSAKALLWSWAKAAEPRSATMAWFM